MGNFKREHCVGIAIGVGVAAVGYYLYKKNQDKVDNFLRKQGINVKTSSSTNYEAMDLETLTEMKEHIEDVIAEKELSAGAVTECDVTCANN
ncbi:hypothetical protein FSBG_01739 [Fusobacterium gonidiaformans 3-1-5R]|uniref:Uncharacterized protein n=2 Tax=Fusobacterium TaxID=848 RepID=E5BIB9_9FUSO|nr:hypothetical protein FSBG_01739 [Fusobacterium gonidiaformans 3-1-5R]